MPLLNIMVNMMLLTKHVEVSISNRNVSAFRKLLGSDLKSNIKLMVSVDNALAARYARVMLSGVCDKCGSPYEVLSATVIDNPKRLEICEECCQYAGRLSCVGVMNSSPSILAKRISTLVKNNKTDSGKKRLSERGRKFSEWYSSLDNKEKEVYAIRCRNRLPPVKFGEDHHNWNPNKTEYAKYRSSVYRETRKHKSVYSKWDNFDEIGRCGVDGAYQMDHIIPIKHGFVNNISPSIIGNIENLQIIPWEENRLKSDKHKE